MDQVRFKMHAQSSMELTEQVLVNLFPDRGWCLFQLTMS